MRSDRDSSLTLSEKYRRSAISFSRVDSGMVARIRSDCVLTVAHITIELLALTAKGGTAADAPVPTLKPNSDVSIAVRRFRCTIDASALPRPRSSGQPSAEVRYPKSA